MTKNTLLVTNTEEARAALLALKATGVYNVSESMRYVEILERVPEWMNELPPNGWYVHFRNRVESTNAVSEREAINNVRWRVYGATPEEECPTFEAISTYNIIAQAVANARGVKLNDVIRQNTTDDLFGRRTISRADALARLQRMRR